MLILAAVLFVDVTQGPLADAGVGEGVAWGDFDGDGDHDLYLGEKTGPNLLLRNDAGTFIDVTAPPLDDPGDGEGIAWADFDNDSDLDLYLVNTFGGANRLFRNDGAAGFTDVASGVVADTTNGEGCAWADWEGDGDVDLYVANLGPNRLLRNDGGGSFRNRANAAGVAHQGTARSVAWGDYDADGDPDLYVTNELTENKLFRNDGEVFADVTGGLPLGDLGSGQGVAWGDWDDDGDLDLYFANRNAFPNKLLRNDGADAFTDVTPGALADLGIGFGVAWGDWDNDGDLDLYLANDGPNRLYRNDGAGAFADVTVAPLDDPVNGRGATWCDYDEDGDLDLYVVNMEAPNRLFRNDGGNLNGWLHLDLVGTVSNAAAIGARVRVVAGGVSRIRDVSGGDGYHSQGSLTVEFGLGSATGADTVEVRWPSGGTQQVVGVAGNQRMTIVESSPTGVAETAGPGVVRLLAPWPNPFERATTIRCQLARGAEVRLTVHDVAGRAVRALERGARGAGRHTIRWDGRADDGRPAAAGVYFVRIETESGARSAPVQLLR